MAECPKCGTEFEAEGKIARCPECNATFKNVPPAPAKKKAKKATAKKVEEKPKPKANEPPTDDMYGFGDDVDLGEVRRQREEADEKVKQEKKKAPKPTIEVKRKNIGDLEVWGKIDRAMLFFFCGVLVWGLCHLLHGLILFLGILQGAEYAGPVVQFLIKEDQPPFELGQGDVLDRAAFVMAMLGGSPRVGLTFGIMLVIQILGWIQMGLWMTGYAIALPGTEKVESGKGELIALFAISGLNFLFSFFLIFLPLVGAYLYIPMPLWGAEIAMAEYNMERSTPLHLFWAYAPFWDQVLTFIVLTFRYLEPAMILYFVWTVASSLKEEPLEQKALGSIRMGFAILFLLMAFQLFAMTGNSPVLVKVLRVLYTLWFLFIILWVVYTAGTLQKCREMFRFYFHPDQD